VDEDPVAFFDVGTECEGRVGRGHGHEETGGVVERPALGNGLEGRFDGADFICVGALAAAEDAVAGGEFGVLGGGRGGEDDAGEFGAADPGELGLPLVFACLSDLYV
jgi:hypothetical protein